MKTTDKSLSTQPKDEDFEIQLLIDNSIEKVFKSITESIPSWWTTMFEGDSKREGDVFTVRFGPNIFKTMRVETTVPYSKVVWKVTDTIIDIPELKNKTEWLNTTIEWHLSMQSGKTYIILKHIGLTPEVECYALCESGWRSFIHSLVSFNESGAGLPYREKPGQ